MHHKGKGRDGVTRRLESLAAQSFPDAQPLSAGVDNSSHSFISFIGDWSIFSGFPSNRFSFQEESIKTSHKVNRSVVFWHVPLRIFTKCHSGHFLVYNFILPVTCRFYRNKTPIQLDLCIVLWHLSLLTLMKHRCVCV